MGSATAEARKTLREALPRAWNVIDSKVYEACWQSMEERCKAVVAANRWQTKY
jgi:hypothetical protein